MHPLLSLLAACAILQNCDAQTAPPWRFEPQELPLKPGIGYAVVVTDVDGDGKPDLVVVDKDRVDWLENPSWKSRPILMGKTKPDNVCIAAGDLDGDGKIDFVLGAAWKPFDTAVPGTLHWLRRGQTLDEEWTAAPIPCAEPTVHRVRIADFGAGPRVVLAPLMGLGATAKAGWNDGRPVRIPAYRVEKSGDRWKWSNETLSQQTHVAHGLTIVPGGVLLGCAEGIVELTPAAAGWRTTVLHPANQDLPNGPRGASEIAAGKLRDGRTVYATIEPWHGGQVVAYVPGADGKLVRKVLDDHLRWGHAVQWADLDGDGNDELVAGVRDDPDAGKQDAFKQRRGVRVYRTVDGQTWERSLLDSGAIAVEDLKVADLDGDGRLDIVAVGRQTHNAKIYWNRQP